MTGHRIALVVAVAACGVQLCAGQTQVPRVLLSNIPGSSTSQLPGQVGWVIRPGLATTDAFVFVTTSPSGEHWALRCRVQAGPTLGEALIAVRNDDVSNARLVARTGDPSHINARAYDSLAIHVGVNNAGQVAYSGNISGSTTDDEVVVRWSPPPSSPTYATMAREGSRPPGQPSGTLSGSFLRAVNLREAGDVGLYMIGVSTNLSARLLYRLSAPTMGQLLADNIMTQPAGQLASPVQIVQLFREDRVLLSGVDDSDFWYLADLEGSTATNQVLARNNIVIAQKGFALPGHDSPVSDLGSVPFVRSPRGMGGDSALFFAAHADTRDSAHLLTPAGQSMLALTGHPVPGSPSDTWADGITARTFLGAALNGHGQWAIAGSIVGPANANTLLVHSSDGVLVREGDGVDMNGDGLANDNVFVDFFLAPGISSGSLALGNNGHLYALVTLRDGSNAPLGSGLLLVTTSVPSGCDSIDFNNDTSFFDPQDIDALLSVYAEGPCVPVAASCNDIDVNNDTSLFDPCDIASFLTMYGEGPCTQCGS